MNARYQNDTERGMGFGILHVSELPALSSKLTFSLQRSRDGRFLGVTGWQDAEEQLTPNSVTAQGDNQFQLAISPAVVEHLEELETYRCNIYGEGLHERCVLELSGVIYAPAAGSGLLEQAKMPAKPVKAAVIPPPAPKPEPEPLPISEPLPVFENAPVKKKSKAPLFLALALIVALAAGGGGWYYVQAQKAAAEQAQKEAVAKAEAEKLAEEKAAADKIEAEKAAKIAEEKAAADKVAAEKAAKEAEEKAVIEKAEAEKAAKEAEEKAAVDKIAAEKVAAEKVKADAELKVAEEKANAEKVAAEQLAKLSAKARVYSFMQGSTTPAAALKLSQELPAAVSAEDQDARFLLLEMAAQGGLAPAMLEVARYYNPADSKPAGTIIKDPEQALSWLQKAEAVPESAQEATAAKLALSQWAEREAKTGNAAAKALLERMK